MSLDGENRVADDCEMTDFDVLKAFLLDIECLSPLDEWTSKFNLFDVLKITRTEIRHSNVLTWLLSPNENHGLADRVLRGLIQYIVSSENSQQFDVFSTLLMDLYSFVFQREWRNIDILAVSDKEKFVICIENKIDSSEHDDQLNRYRAIIDHTYPSYQKVFIYLTPSGAPASDETNWISVGYDDVLNILDNAVKQVELLPEAAMLINNYIDTIRRDIVKDERLAQICAEIYAKHGKALDLIFEHRPDRASIIAQIIQTWCYEKQRAGLLVVDTDKCSKTYTRFKTPFMTKLLPDKENADSGWNTKNQYFYEVVNRDGERIYIQFVVSGRNIPDDLRSVDEQINTFYPTKYKKEAWQWRTHFASKTIKIDVDTPEEKIIEQLEKRLEEVFSFEHQLQEKLHVSYFE